MAEWQAHHVQIRLVEAMAVQRRVVARLGPSVPRSSWPSIVRSLREIEEADQDVPKGSTPPTTMVLPTRAELAHMERAENWMRRFLSVDACTEARMPPDTGWVVGMRAMGWGWDKIGRTRKRRHGFKVNAHAAAVRLPGGNSRPALSRIEADGLAHIADCLQRENIPVDVDLMVPA